MNPFLRKELRLLVPSFPIAWALSLSVWLLPTHPNEDPGLVFLLPFVLCPALVVIMALDSFGREIASGTLPQLLAQPIPRTQVWRTKTTVLAAAIAGVGLTWWLSLLLHPGTLYEEQGTLHLALAAALFGASVFSGALWTVLLLRQVVAAFWFTFLVPALLAIAMAHAFDQRPEAFRTAISTLLVAYAGAGFWAARWLFLRAQDLQWTGDPIAWPARWSRSPDPGQDRPRRTRHPNLALVGKELRLHQSTLVVAAALAALHLVVRGLRTLAGPLGDSPMLEILLQQFWLLWLFMPLLAGCTSTAEERKLGTHEAQLCLPVHPRRQLLLKASVALALSFLLGLGMPLLLDFDRVTHDLGNSHWQFVTAAASIALLASVASTLARNTLQSLAPACLGLLLLWGLMLAALQNPTVSGRLVWQGPLVGWIGFPLLGLTLLGLLHHNYRQTLVGWPLWRRNLLILSAALALAGTATATLYHRAWELLRPAEPQHGAPLFPQPPTVHLDESGTWILARLPDGRVWVNRFVPQPTSPLSRWTGDWQPAEVLPGGRFLEGSNWTSATACFLDMVAVAQDGTLWVSERPEDRRDFWTPQTQPAPPIRMTRVGADTNWKTVVGSYPPALLLKHDGSLWKLGPHRVNHDWPGLQAEHPQRLGDANDWTELIRDDYRTILRKKDGTAWITSTYGDRRPHRVPLDEHLTLERAPFLERPRWRGLASVSLPRTANLQLEVSTQGALRIPAAWMALADDPMHRWGMVPQDVTLDASADWLDLVGRHGGSHVSTLRADGSLWTWTFPDDVLTHPNRAAARRLSVHSDWIAIAPLLEGTLALAADGSLWFWEGDPRTFSLSNSDRPPWLGPSRRPHPVGRIPAAQP